MKVNKADKIPGQVKEPNKIINGKFRGKITGSNPDFLGQYADLAKHPAVDPDKIIVGDSFLYVYFKKDLGLKPKKINFYSIVLSIEF